MKVDFDIREIAVLTKAFYEFDKNVESEIIPDHIYFAIASILNNLVDDWDTVGISFFDWCHDILFIYPKVAFAEEDIVSFQKENQLFFEFGDLLVTGWLGENV